MSFDNSRFTFDPGKNYSGVVMPQGRVQLDSDWNEWLSEIARRFQAGTLDIVGRAVYPATTPDAFYISPSATAWVVNIGAGRMYVDGLLAENHSPGILPAPSWDTALAEDSPSPQPPPPSIGGSPSVAYTAQQFFPGAPLPTAAGSYLYYLDVWTRAVTWLQDSDLVDKAVGVDTSGRLQTVWQVRYMAAAAANAATPGTAVTCATPDVNIAYPARSFGLLSNNTVPNQTAGPCCLTDGSGYTGIANQFYRVEIHQGGPLGTATFKWSRENASVMTAVRNIASLTNSQNQLVSVLTVASLGRDQVLGFSNGDWIELLNDALELNGMPDPNSNPYGAPGLLCQIDHVLASNNTIFLTALIDTSALPGSAFPVGTPTPSANTRIRRWDQSGTVYSSDVNGTLTQVQVLSGSSGDIKVPAANTMIVLEDGVTVSFGMDPAGTTFLSGDFWTFAARTFDGSLYPMLVNAPPRGIHHHYTKLSVVTFSATGSATSMPDCRTPWASSDEGDCGCCTVTVGDNVTSFGKFSSIQQAVMALPVQGGEVCILPGKYYENIVLNGSTEVTLRGSGPQTVLYSPSQQAGGTADGSGSTASIATYSGLSAILTMTGCKHVQVTGLTIEAPDAMACILIDQGTTPPPSPTFPNLTDSGIHVTLSDLILSASTRPAIAAVYATLLTICDNRILMKDVAGTWPGIYVSGAEITIANNWIGLQDNADAVNQASPQLVTDLGTNVTAATSAPVGNGGVQVGGYSTGVAITGNQITGGAFNGITLGSILLYNQAAQVPGLNGVQLTAPTPNNPATLMLPATIGNYQVAADGPLQNILIERNTITGTGLCAIGPVGFFPSASTPEIISIGNLSVLGNTLGGSLQASISPILASALAAGAGSLGYGAICLPDLQGLILRDNIITDFGPQPGAQVCGIYILNVERAEIARNEITETRDWTAIPTNPAAAINGSQAGIYIVMVSPPALDQSATVAAWTGSSAQGLASSGTPPLYQPGLPALTIHQNTVRVALGASLTVVGYGPFSITANQLSTGGTVPAISSSSATMNVAIMNLGLATEFDTPTSFTQLYNNLGTGTPLQAVDNVLADSTCGLVMFTNNACHVETRGSGATGLCSVAIFSLDHVTFANNHTWFDGEGQIPGTTIELSAAMDAMLLGITVQATANRFQEGVGTVLFSALTAAIFNVTSQNISTFCLYTMPASANINNISLTPAETCAVLGKYIFPTLYPAASGLAVGTTAGSIMNMNYAASSAATDPGLQVSSAVAQADTTSATQVQQLALVHQARLNLATRYSSSVTANFGATSPQAVDAAARVTSAQADVARVSMLKLRVASAAPQVNPNGWALYGHVYNSTNAAVAGYSVYFVDSTNTYQNAYGIAYTAADGSFQIVYAGVAVGQPAPAVPQLFVQVSDASGNPVYLSTTAFTPTTGLASYQDITLPAGQKPLGTLPIVLRPVILPVLDPTIAATNVTPIQAVNTAVQTPIKLPDEAKPE